MKHLIIALLILPAGVMAQVKNIPHAAPGSSHVTKDTAGICMLPIDVRPSFTGGQEAWVNFLRQNLDANRVSEYQDSTSLTRYGNRQTVRVKFVVCEDGSLCNFEVINKETVSPAAADEAIRVMKHSPAWTPGQRQHQNVKTYFLQPITFYFE